MPQAAMFGLSLFMALLFEVLSVLFAFIETGAGEPLSRNLLSLSGGWVAHTEKRTRQQGRAIEGAAGSRSAFGRACGGSLQSPPQRPRPPPLLLRVPLAAGSHFFVRRILKFVLPLVPVALKTAPRWEASGMESCLQLSQGVAHAGCAPSPLPTPTRPFRFPSEPPLQVWVNFTLTTWLLYITIR